MGRTAQRDGPGCSSKSDDTILMVTLQKERDANEKGLKEMASRLRRERERERETVTKDQKNLGRHPHTGDNNVGHNLCIQLGRSGAKRKFQRWSCDSPCKSPFESPFESLKLHPSSRISAECTMRGTLAGRLRDTARSLQRVLVPLFCWKSV